jgi:hypothetical protein
MSPACSVFTPRLTRVTVSAFTVRFSSNPDTYEMYRDFQENTINSDGSFGMWLSYIFGGYFIHQMYNYFVPWYWNKNAHIRNGEEERIRMKDAISSTTLEESTGIQVGEWGWNPHDFHSIRRRLSSGLSHPDDVRAMHMSTCNRKHRYVEHYRHKIGNEETTMIQR